jgi:hypothetical protein
MPGHGEHRTRHPRTPPSSRTSAQPRPASRRYPTWRSTPEFGRQCGGPRSRSWNQREPRQSFQHAIYFIADASSTNQIARICTGQQPTAQRTRNLWRPSPRQTVDLYVVADILDLQVVHGDLSLSATDRAKLPSNFMTPKPRTPANGHVLWVSSVWYPPWPWTLHRRSSCAVS